MKILKQTQMKSFVLKEKLLTLYLCQLVLVCWKTKNSKHYHTKRKVLFQDFSFSYVNSQLIIEMYMTFPCAVIVIGLLTGYMSKKVKQQHTIMLYMIKLFILPQSLFTLTRPWFLYNPTDNSHLNQVGCCGIVKAWAPCSNRLMMKEWKGRIQPWRGKKYLESSHLLQHGL